MANEISKIELNVNVKNPYEKDNTLPAHTVVESLMKMISKINEMIDTLNGVPEDVNISRQRLNEAFDLVDTTKNMLYGASAIIHSKRDRNEKITSDDLDKSKDAVKIKLSNLADEVLNVITGGAPVNNIIADGSIVTEKIVDNAVTIDKLDRSLKTKLENQGRLKNTSGSDYTMSFEINDGVINLVMEEIPLTLNTIAYEGFTYKELFEEGSIIVNGGMVDGDLNGVADNWNIYPTTELTSISNVNSIQHFMGAGNTDMLEKQLYQNTTTFDNKKYYYGCIARGSGVAQFRLRHIGANNISFGSLTNEFTLHTVLQTKTGETESDRFTFSTAVGERLFVKYAFAIQLPNFIVPPTKEKMDEMLNTYLQLKGVNINEY